MAGTASKKRQRKQTSPRRLPPRVAEMTTEELRKIIESSVEHKLVEWFGSPEDARDEQEWARQFSGSQDALTRPADEARAELRQGRTEPLDPDLL